MESQILPVAAAPTSPPPTHMRDMRPTADSAALARNPRPDIPLPMPASIAQKGAVAQAQIGTDTSAVAAVERVLKPYGVVMLPHGPADAKSKVTWDDAPPDNTKAAPSAGTSEGPAPSPEADADITAARA